MEPVAEAILNVLTIIALIAAVAFIIILLVDLVLSITNKKGSIFFRGRNADKDNEVKVKPADDNSRPEVMADTSTQPVRKTWDEAEAEREQQALLAGQNGMPDENQGAERKSFADERQEMIERRKQEFDDFDDFDSLFEDTKVEEPKADEPKVEESSDDEDFNFDDMINEINSESVMKYEEGDRNETVVTVAEEPEVTEVQPEVVEEPAVEEVIEEHEVEDVTESAQATVTAEESVTPVDDEPTEPEEPIEPVLQPAPIVNVYEYFPQDLLEERLKKLQERLKVNERDLRGNRKEFNPLARVKRNLARDQEKLRRKEAVIARKKVLLYGVNNYVDIDEEKAKKLSEDLDLLDGLRLSVQHCEEVMEQNKDRYPILEKTNQILVEQNRQIKDDIAEVEAAIAKLKESE